jgi:hypothetical protein
MAQVIETVFSIRTEESIANLNEVVGSLGRTEQAAKRTAKSVSDEVAKIPAATKRAASGFNGLSNSINQVSRELPAFAFSAQTGFLAISNNIPILIDEITNLRKANALLVAEGKASIPIWKLVAGALFSWQTALSVGISLSVLYGKELGAFFKELFKGKEAFNLAKINLEALNKAYDSPELKSGVQSLYEMRINLASANAGFINKKATLEEYNKTFGITFGIAKSVDEAEKNLINGTPAYINALIQRAAATELINQAAADIVKRDKAYKDSQELKEKILQQTLRDEELLVDEEDAFAKHRLQNQKGILDREVIALDNSQKKKLELAQGYADKAAKFLKLGIDDSGKPDDDKKKAKTAEQLLQERLDAELNLAQANYVKILETKVSTDKQKEQADLDYLDVQIAILQRYSDINKKYTDEMLSLRQSRAEKEIKINQDALEKENKDYFKFVKDGIDNETNQITEKYTAIRGGREKTRLESLKIDLLETQEKISHYDRIKEVDQKYSDGLIDLKKKEEKIKTDIANEGSEEREKLDKEIQQAALTLTQSISDKVFQRQRDNANATTDAELANLEVLKEKKLISEDEFAKRKADIMNRNAETQRKADLAQIQVNTALSIIKTFAQLGFPAGIVPAALAAAEGLVQYAFASSQPLPKFYAKGTDRVTGGIAGRDSVSAMLMPNEAVIPAKANMERQGLAKAWIGGDLDRHLAMNYINPAINEVNRKWETSLKLNQQSTFIRNDNFSDKKIVGELVKSNRLNRVLISSLSDNKSSKRNRRSWN